MRGQSQALNGATRPTPHSCHGLLKPPDTPADGELRVAGGAGLRRCLGSQTRGGQASLHRHADQQPPWGLRKQDP